MTKKPARRHVKEKEATPLDVVQAIAFALAMKRDPAEILSTFSPIRIAIDSIIDKNADIKK